MKNDKAAERVVLAGLYQYGYDIYIDICDIVDEKSFSDEGNQSIFKCLKHLVSQTGGVADVPSIMSAAKTLGIESLVETQDQLRYIQSLINFPVTIKNAFNNAIKLKKLQLINKFDNRLVTCRSELNEFTGEEEISEIIGKIQNSILEETLQISNADSNNPKHISEGLEEYIEHLENNENTQLGICSGFKVYDEAIGGGLRPGTVNLVGARMKTGKSFFADNVAINVSSQNIPVLMFDTEMTERDHWYRLLARISNIKMQEIENGSYAKDKAKKDRVLKGIEKLKSMNFHYKSIAGKGFDEVISMARRWVMKEVGLNEMGKAKPCLIILDYVKLMSDGSITKNIAEYQALGFLMTSLHNFMTQYGVACLAFTQLNRDGINREDTDIAAGSDRMLWLASSFAIYKRKTPEELSNEGHDPNSPVYNLKLIPIVSRYGKGIDAGDYINISAEYEYGRIVEGPTARELEKNRSPRMNSPFTVTGDANAFEFGSTE